MKRAMMIVMAALFALCAAGAFGEEAGEVWEHHYEEEFTPASYPDTRYRVSADFHLADVTSPDVASRLFRVMLYGGRSPREYAEVWERDYAAGLEGWIGEAQEGDYTAEYSEWVSVDYADDEVILASRETYEYRAPAAHGMPRVEYFVFDLDAKKPLSLGNVFVEPVPDAALAALVRAQYGISPEAPLAENGFFGETFWPPESFTFAKEGVLFLWNVYAVAPYSTGAVKVIVPYTAAARYMNARGRAIAARFQ